VRRSKGFPAGVPPGGQVEPEELMAIDPFSRKGRWSMYTRLFHAEMQSGKEEQALKVLDEFVLRVKQQPGCIFNQVLRSGVHVVGVSSWRTQEELAHYADSDLAQELWKRITPFLMGAPVARTYEVRMNLCDPEALKPV
jgi:quinol monooxygenase YgiN